MDLEQLSELIRRRRYIFHKEYTGGHISEETIIRLLENANWAPTHAKTEPWRFIVIQGEGLGRLGQYLASKYKDQTPADQFSRAKFDKTLGQPALASAVLGICMQRDPESRIPEWEEMAAVAAAVQNLWLSATAMGLAGYWSTPKAIIGDISFLKLKPGEQCLGLFYLGTWDPKEKEAKRGDIREKIHWMNS